MKAGGFKHNKEGGDFEMFCSENVGLTFFISFGNLQSVFAKPDFQLSLHPII